MAPPNRALTIGFVAAFVIAGARVTVLPDARWWNLVMAALLLAVLGLYLWRERARAR